MRSHKVMVELIECEFKWKVIDGEFECEFKWKVFLKRAFMTSNFALEHSDQLHVPELIRRPATSSTCATPRT